MPVLRVILGTIGVAALAGAVIGIFLGAPVFAVLWLFCIGLTLTVGVLFERVHYKLLAARAPGPGWVATDERFVDPTTGRMVQVHIKPDTGERLYVDRGAAAQKGGH
jgi:hypothetical protein